ncbi:metallophosphoesterase family protein, partial [Chloroflexota bacterium]
DPCQCIKLLRGLKHICVAGNHDRAAIGRVSTAKFNPDAAAACHWTAGQLTPKDTVYLESLPLTIHRESFTLVHGSPREPVWEYVISNNIALINFDFFQSQFCLVGHSHVPLIFKSDDSDCSSNPFSPGVKLVLGKSRLIINPGGVGQPRDGDPRASYAIYDSEPGIITNYRVPYDIESTQEKIMGVGLPIRLATRLSRGI